MPWYYDTEVFFCKQDVYLLKYKGKYYIISMVV